MDPTELARRNDVFRNVLLYRQEDKVLQLKQEMERELSPEEMNVFLSTANAWLDQCLELEKKALALAEIGKNRDSLEFDELKKQAKALGGNVCGYLCQKFDQAVIEYETRSNAENLPGDQSASRKAKGFLLGEITTYSTWGKRGRQRLLQCLEEIRKLYPEAVKEAERRKVRGEKIAHYKTLAANSSQENLSELLKQMRKEGFFEYEISLVRKMKDKIKLSKEITQTAARLISPPSSPENEPEFAILTRELSFRNIHPNSIPELAPAAEWTILFDETGTDFKESAFGNNVSDLSLGRMVALVVPDYTELPPCREKCHSVDLLPSEIHAMQQTLLSHKCGIIGIPVNALYRIHAEQWFACIETLLDLILRLLPISGKTRLKIYVEQRGKVTARNDYLLQKTCDDCLYHLSRAFPERSLSVEMEPHIIRKEDHPWNGYVDAVAFCWSSPSGRVILNESGWNQTCLINSSPYFLRRCIDVMEREESIQPADWTELLNTSTTETNSLGRSLLINLGERAKQAPAIWKNYLDHVVTHLNSKAINMRLLGRQLNWLSTYMPAEEELPPRLRLLWLTAKLAEENHRGCVATHPDSREEFLKLSERLFEEDAPLVCNAALNLAVSYTDEFDFVRARQLLDPWMMRRPEVPGLQYYGRLLSSYGQCEAFQGNNTEAISCFRQAIEAFGRLSEAESARLDIQQTSAYLLTSLMECLPERKEEFIREAEMYFGGRICEVAPRLGVSIEDGSKYQHHILLRYLSCADSSPEERNAYLSSAGQWRVGIGHPWEMIEFYRASLVETLPEKVEHLQNAYEIAMTGAGTMHVIGAVILGSLLLLQPEREQEYRELVDRCAAEIPALGERLNILQRHCDCKYQPLELAARVLPFNFR